MDDIHIEDLFDNTLQDQSLAPQDNIRRHYTENEQGNVDGFFVFWF